MRQPSLRSALPPKRKAPRDSSHPTLLDTIPDGARVFKTGAGLAAFLHPLLLRRRTSGYAERAGGYVERALTDLDNLCERALHGRGVGPGLLDAEARILLERACEKRNKLRLRLFPGYATYLDT